MLPMLPSSSGWAPDVRQHQVLHGKFDIDHAARAVLDLKHAGGHRVGCAHALAHGDDLVRAARWRRAGR